MFKNRKALARTERHEDALACVEAGIEAAHPSTVLSERVAYDDGTLTVCGETYDLDAVDDVFVVGGGNAAGTAASALAAVLGDRLAGGAIVTDDPAPTERIAVLPGDHPVPTDRSVDSTRRVMSVARDAGPDDLVLALVTGGGSALLVSPAGDVTLSALRAVTDELLASGAPIDDINAVRKHLSTVKGGYLAEKIHPAASVSLIFSDVVGNDLGTVASGPTVPDRTTYDDALAVLEAYDIDTPAVVDEHLRTGATGALPETPSGDDPVFDSATHHVLADNMTAVEAAASAAESRGYTPVILSTRVRGEAREAAKSHAAVAEECRATGNPVAPPAAIISGGETTVTGPGSGTGGPNQEFAVSGALELSDPDTILAAVDTDGIDGNSDVAGGLVDHETAATIDTATSALDTHETTRALREADAAVETGPTGTNVNDLRIHLVDTATGHDSQ